MDIKFYDQNRTDGDGRTGSSNWVPEHITSQMTQGMANRTTVPANSHSEAGPWNNSKHSATSGSAINIRQNEWRKSTTAIIEKERLQCPSTPLAPVSLSYLFRLTADSGGQTIATQMERTYAVQQWEEQLVWNVCILSAGQTENWIEFPKN